MNNRYTFQQATELDKCPNCGYLLHNQDGNSKLMFFSDRELDCITHYKCPNCKKIFLRNQEELNHVKDNI